jgi:geranylgeranyl diphosphate synthase type II
LIYDEFLKELEERAGIVNQSLEQFLPTAETYPPVIHQALRYSLFAGGKRLRPVLVIAAARTVGGESTHVLPAACALELIHTYSLIHDDLPAMDNDDFRRGKPASHCVYGEAIAVLAGDALLTLAFELMTCHTLQQFIPAGRILRTIGEIASAAGTAGMIGGQVMDILSENAEMDGHTMEYIHRHKTGALYRAAVRAGAILAGAGESQLSALTEYAENLGLAFQIKDDILDVEGDDTRPGKPAGNDKKNKKATYPVLFGMQTASEKAAYATATAKEALKDFDQQADFLRFLADYVINRDF